MRPVIAYFLTAASLAFAASSAYAADTTLILQFEQPHSERTLTETRNELGTVMRSAGFTFDLKLFSELGPTSEFTNLMVIKLKGRCKLDAGPAPKPERTALAFTHISDGRVLPFIEVSCDRVRGIIRPIMWGEQFRTADELMGRALARVIAHEIYHVMTGTKHSGGGIAHHSLTGTQLIANDLFFRAEDLERMVQSNASPEPPTE
ncbi:MAG: hypothetical protein H7039_07290 [Bryobacteraceae bacterium]|nr:hypothetical protein [Bryobacteraceae bacterium]